MSLPANDTCWSTANPFRRYHATGNSFIYESAVGCDCFVAHNGAKLCYEKKGQKLTDCGPSKVSGKPACGVPQVKAGC